MYKFKHLSILKWFKSKFLTAEILIKYIQGIYDKLDNEEVSLDIDMKIYHILIN